MSAKPVKNMAASVRDRLLKLAHERGEDFQLVLTYYALERLMYRISLSTHRDRFILKGAMLFSVWSKEPYRATSDLDLWSRGDNGVAALEKTFREICGTAVENDGLEFAVESIHGEEIRAGQEYEGVRLTFEARLAVARIPIQVDVGFGDALGQKPESLQYPTLLDFPAPRLLTYPREVVVAEKFQAMVALGMGNSRMKDFFDVLFLARHFEFDGVRLSEAIAATFNRRKTPLPTAPPLALTADFYNDRTKQMQWRGFLKKGKLEPDATDLAEVVAVISGFLMPPTVPAAGNKPFTKHWPAGGSWMPSKK